MPPPNASRPDGLQGRRSYTAIERMVAVLSAQDELGSREMDLQGLFEAVSERVRQLTQAGGVALHLVDGDQLRCRAAVGLSRDKPGRDIPIEGFRAYAVVAEGHAHRSADAQDDPLVDAAWARLLDARSLMLSPLRGDGRTIGLMTVTAADKNAFDDLDLLTARFMSRVVTGGIIQWDAYKAKHALAQEHAARVHTRKASERRFGTLLGAVGYPIAVLDDELSIVDCNDAFCMLAASTRDDLTLRDLPSLLHADTDYVATADAAPFPARLLRRDGSMVATRLRIVPLPTMRGEAGSALALFGDAPPTPRRATARHATSAATSLPVMDLVPVVARALRVFQPTAQFHGIRLEPRLPAKLDVRADAALLEHAMRRIVENVVRTAPAQGHIVVQAGMGQGAAMVQFSGTGIQMDRLRRILPQAGPPTDRDGLGLDESQRVLHSMGGRLWWHQKDKQTLLGFSLPV